MTLVTGTSQLERTYQETPADERWPIQLFNIAQTSIEKHALEVIYEHLIRGGGACHVTPRRIASTVAKRMKGIRFNSKLNLAVRDLIQRLPWASFWDRGVSHGGISFLERDIYALFMEKSKLTSIHEFIAYSKRIRESDSPSIRKRILDALSHEFPLSSAQLATRLKMARIKITSRVPTMVRNGEIFRVRRGFYCLPEHIDQAKEKLDSTFHPFDIKVLELLKEEYPLTPSDIAKRLQTSYPFIGKTLRRLIAKNEVSKMQNGTYCLPSLISNVVIPLSTRELILALLSKKFPLTPKQISKHINRRYLVTVGIMRGMLQHKEIIKVRRGFYCLPG